MSIKEHLFKDSYYILILVKKKYLKYHYFVYMLCGEGNLLPEIEDEESDDSDFELDSSSNKETSTKSENEE